MSQEPIAVIGTACRFAGDVDTPSKLWEVLKDPTDLRQEIPKERFNTDGFYHHDHAYHGHTNVKHSYLLSQDPATFDAEFFSINPIEARSMDPQQRLILETVYEAIESAGLTIEGMSGSDTCVYAGSMTADYDAAGTRDLDQLPTYAAVGTSRAILSNRVSYFFNWKGASVTMDTACSSSLVALHNAIQDLRLGDSGTAVVCGSNLILGPECYIIESTVKMLSPDGLSRMWDKDANGYARGEGLAALIIKPLSAALRDNDNIECIIRGTGTNQDGNTAGLTMPSPISQKALIEKTYAKAGLDLSKVDDRPQYFEAHGTGTPAGDPVEAEAIHSAFMTSDTPAAPQRLYVGSIKTVLGHTEGTAGLAGVMKAMLAIQNSCIPPNLHLNELNPAVKPFYKNLEIPQNHCPWPQLNSGQVRRASVNSFGFGGSNAHAIIESYDNNQVATSDHRTIFGPFVFSAASEKALRSNLEAYVEYLGSAPSHIAPDLAYTLRSRRSLLQYRLAVPAADGESLREKLVEFIAGNAITANNGIVRTLSKIGSESTSILGVFTGQGAQYAAMGAELVRASPWVRQIIMRLEAYLMDLPKDDQPSWSLEAELLADAATSRSGESALSQPLNTAVQIMLVDVLRAAGVHFDAVVGHSSGEIAAAYAAGFLSARDAICISYYRGVCCQYAQSPNGDLPGAMLAVGTSMEDALELCKDETFAGRISLAAVNSPSSVTISGDSDAIEELMVVMEDEKKFHRRLRVDKAYHSSHMKACAEMYRNGMIRAKVSAERTSQARLCQWYSSVYDGELVDESFELAGEYWLKNLIQPVMFAPALSAALKSSSKRFDAAVEVGPHPALQGPSAQIMQDELSSSIPYSGTLQRNGNALTSLSATLGFLWSHLDTHAINLDSFEREMAGDEKLTFHLLKHLPRYQWNHATSYWSESRRSKHLRTRSEAVHALLGHITADSGSHALRWKHLLKPAEMPWLKGHAVQNQIVFPAAGYISTAMEAVRFLAKDDETIQLIDLVDFVIHQAIPFSGEDNGIEVLVEISQIVRSKDNQQLTANFSYSAALGGSAGKTDLSLVATSQIQVRFGEPSVGLLTERQPELPHMIDIKPQRLYDWLASLEYNFSDPFRALTKLRRKLGFARCTGQSAQRDADSAGLWVHPADLDAAFQAVNLAFSFPGDEQIRHLHLPTTISNIRINPAALSISRSTSDVDEFNVDAVWSPSDPLIPTTGISGNASLYFGQAESQFAGVQFDSVVLQPIGDANDERKIYHGLEYVPTQLNGTLAAEKLIVTDATLNLMQTLRRVVFFYARQFDREVPVDSEVRKAEVTGNYLNYCHHITNELKQGVSKFGKPEYLQDTKEDVMNALHELGTDAENTADVKLVLLVGETMPRVLSGEADNMMEEMRLSGLLGDFYQYGAGLQQATMWIKATLKQITDRSPHLRMVELGAGTAAASKDILNTIGRNFDEYTLTDISSGFADGALESLAGWKDQTSFKVCNVEVDPIEQGFIEGEYDVAIASQILHATADLGQTVRNVRRMLKPGGWLLMGECSPDGGMREVGSFVFGTFSGWWNGVHEGRVLSPFASFSQWDTILRENGFGGIEVRNPDNTADAFGVVCIAAQAVDTRVSILRSPLAAPANSDVDRVLLIGGGQSTIIAPIVEQLQQILKDLGTPVSFYNTLEDLDDQLDTPGATVISLADVVNPVFENMTPARWEKFQQLFIGHKSVLWVSCGRLKDGLYSNMTVGFGRCALNEEADLRLQNLDFADISQLDARRIAEAFIRFTNKSVVDASSKNQLLHTDEREIIFDGQGREMVPRLSHQTRLNDRLRSVRRAAPYETDLQSQEVSLEQNSSGRYLRQLSRFDKTKLLKGIKHDFLQLRTTYSTLGAIRTPLGFQSLVIGIDHDAHKYLALADSTTSTLRIDAQCAVRVEQEDKDDSTLLNWAATRLTALAIFGTALPGHRMIVHNASAGMAASISAEAQKRGVRLIFTTSVVSDDKKLRAVTDSTPYIRLQPYAGMSEILAAVNVDVACLVDFSRESNALSTTLAAAVPAVCRRETLETLYAPVAAGNISADSSKEPLRQLLSQALQETMPRENKDELTCVALGDVVGVNQEHAKDALTVVDWTRATSLPARICRLDVSPMFQPDKTYWLCGLSGALGISICDWMIDRGVRNMVISSRNPRMDQRWVEHHSIKGATIKIMSCDVTNEKEIRNVHQDIVQSLPPIAGVVSAAMVLRDVSVRNMQYDQLQDVIRPKVMGSIHLDSIFHDINLDFFIVLSSTNAIIGNPGQANYAAANMGMAGVANRRRHRGLRASAAHVGAIMGVGYVTDSIERLELAVTMTNMIRVGEQEVHQMIAEVFEAGFEDSSVHPELVMGLKEVSRSEPGQSKWSDDPKFSRLILPSSAGNANKGAGGTTEESVKEKLEACKTEQEIHRVLQQAFAAQLRRILFIKLSDEEIMESASSNLGLDSLIAVDIRSWILKTFGVNVPVLKIMSADARMSDLVAATLEDLPQRMTPLFDRKGGEKEGSSEARDSSTTDSDTTKSDGDSSSTADVTGVTTPQDSSMLKDNSIASASFWDQEALAPAGLVVNEDAPAKGKVPEIVLLTGCTGLLGHHVLNALLQQSSITKVICIGIRRLSQRLAAAELPPPSSRIEYHEGDLAVPGFGLDEATRTRIFNAVDAVIHNGADTSHMKSYATLHDTNVQSTRQLIRLCVPRRTSLHYISSAGIALASSVHPFPSIAVDGSSEKLDEITRSGARGYMCSKWVCERMLENAHREYGLPVCIQRPSTIIRHGEDAKTQRAGFDWVNTLLQYAHEIHAVPLVRHNKGALDLVSVQTCCEDILREVMSRHSAGDGITYQNNVGDMVIPLANLGDIAIQQGGLKEAYPKISWEEWVAQAVEKGLHPAVAALIEAIDEPGGFDYPLLLRAQG